MAYMALVFPAITTSQHQLFVVDQVENGSPNELEGWVGDTTPYWVSKIKTLIMPGVFIQTSQIDYKH